MQNNLQNITEWFKNNYTFDESMNNISYTILPEHIRLWVEKIVKDITRNVPLDPKLRIYRWNQDSAIVLKEWWYIVVFPNILITTKKKGSKFSESLLNFLHTEWQLVWKISLLKDWWDYDWRIFSTLTCNIDFIAQFVRNDITISSILNNNIPKI